MHVFITGGTGMIGRALTDRLLLSGYQVTILTRNESKARLLFGDRVKYQISLDNTALLDDYDIVINLAGEPIIGKRWTAKQKARLCDSRWNITRRLTELIKKSKTPPSVFISGSAVGYYGSQNDIILTEESKPHNEFTHYLCREWEYLAQEASSVTRVCIVRTGIVLSDRGGMLPKMALPFKLGLGCITGNGSQYVSWIHIEDMVGGIIHLIESPKPEGIFNFTSPNPETNRNFSKLLAQTLHRPCIFHIPSFIIKLAMGEASTMLTKGQRVVPKGLEEAGYDFRFPNLSNAFDNLLIR